MPSYETLGLFVLAAVLFAAIPGTAVFYIVTRSVSQGRQAGVVSAVGVGTGNLLYVAAGVLGLTALLASSAAAFTVVKYAGAGYLIYLGLRTLLGRGEQPRSAAPGRSPAWSVYRQGVLVAALNPKTALFFLAFLPQFVDLTRGPAAAQIGLLGVLLVLVTVLSDICYALLAGSAGSWLRRRPGIGRGTRLATGGAYIALGVGRPWPASAVRSRPAEFAGSRPERRRDAPGRPRGCQGGSHGRSSGCARRSGVGVAP